MILDVEGEIEVEEICREQRVKTPKDNMTIQRPWNIPWQNSGNHLKLCAIIAQYCNLLNIQMDIFEDLYILKSGYFVFCL